jgi:hypothetical protein
VALVQPYCKAKSNLGLSDYSRSGGTKRKAHIIKTGQFIIISFGPAQVPPARSACLNAIINPNAGATRGRLKTHC